MPRAAAEGVPPEACLVVEDSLPGIAAARAAGMTVIGLETHGNGAVLREAGAHPIRLAWPSCPPSFTRAAALGGMTIPFFSGRHVSLDQEPCT